MRRFEGTPNAAQSPYSPNAVTLSAHYIAKFPPSSTASGQFDDMNDDAHHVRIPKLPRHLF